MEPLSFPPPPPPPAVPQRAASSASWRSVEPSLDDIVHEISQLKTDIDEIDQSLQDIEMIKDQVVNSELPANQLLHPLKQLSSATTSTGTRILTISAPLTSVSTRLSSLSERAAEGKAAATTLECSAAEEELEVLKISVKDLMERVKSMAYEELQGRGATRERWERRIRAENPSAGEDVIQMSVQQAMTGLNRKVAELDVASYAGRCAAENPFTELAATMESAAEIHRTGSIHSAASSTTAIPLSRTQSQFTLVGSSTDPYGKLEVGEDGDLESQPLRGQLGGGVTGAETTPTPKKGWRSKWDYTKKNWRDVLIRTVVGVVLSGTVVGIIVYEALNRPHGDSVTLGSGLPLGPGL